MNALGKNIGLATLLSGAALGLASVASAQSAEFNSCATMAAAACIQQIGNSNEASINQTGATRALAVIDSRGNRNDFSIDQRNSTDSYARVTTAADSANNMVSVKQRGEGNRAVAAIDGSRNGKGGTRTFNANAGLNRNLDASDTPLLTYPVSTRVRTIAPDNVESGLISQDGNYNSAGVAIFGRGNDFHIRQKGDFNSAAQVVSGVDNQAAAVQAQGGGAVRNTSVQVQLGITNSAYVEQKGDNNTSIQVQSGSGLAGFVAAAGGLASLAGNDALANSAERVLIDMKKGGEGANNQLVLQQNNDNNFAQLGQFGTNNKLALAQSGEATAIINQFGNGNQLGIDQRLGQSFFGSSQAANPIVITQFKY